MKYLNIILILVLVNSIWLTAVDSKSRKSSKKKVIKKGDKKPNDISGGLYCEASQAIL